jgi:mannose-6-phosphate isomerase-like protein (cupin superfamily)
MPELIPAPALIPVPGGKLIEEYVGHASSGDDLVSVAHMLAPAGWEEPAQEPEFDEFTIVLEGSIDVEHDDGVIHVRAGQAVITRGGERIRYTTHEGARYIAVCLPAFHGDRVHRDDDDEYDRDPVE